MINNYLSEISGCIGVCRDDIGYRLDFISASRYATDSELITAKKQALKKATGDLCADKIALIFGYSANSLELITHQMNLSVGIQQLMWQQTASTIPPPPTPPAPLTGEQINYIAEGSSKMNRVSALRAYAATLYSAIDTCDPTTFDITAGWPE